MELISCIIDIMIGKNIKEKYMSKYKINKKKHSIYNSSENLISLLLLLPICFIVTVLPLIVKYHESKTNMEHFDWYPNTSTVFDIFLYYKQWFFVAVCGVILLIILIRSFYLKKKLSFHRIFLPLITYSILAILSTVFSKYSSFGISGIIHQYENIFSLIGYILIAYYIYNTVNTEYELRLLINSLAIGALILGILGSFQFFGLDYMNSRFIRSIILSNNADLFEFDLLFDSGHVYTTMFNPNYVGVYTAFIVPLFSILIFFSKKLKEYILYGAVIITSIISLIGSQSKTALISIFVSLVIACIMLRKIIIKKWYLFVSLGVIFIVSFVIFNALNNNQYLNAIKNVFNIEKSEQPNLSSMDTSSDGVWIEYKGNKMIVSLSSDHDIILKDSNDNYIASSEYSTNEDGSIVLQIQDQRFNDIPIIKYPSGSAIDFCLVINQQIWPFSNTAVPNYYTYYNRYNKFSSIQTADSMFFNGYEKLATSRGYLWSRTIPLIKDNIILGTGADTFFLVFPQHDYVAFHNYGYADQLITKPHNYYLQTAVQTGLISLLCLLTFFIIYLIQSVKIYFRNTFVSFQAKIGLASLLAIISYLVSGFSNDSFITVSPVAWVIIGIGLASNKLVTRSSLSGIE